MRRIGRLLVATIAVAGGLALAAAVAAPVTPSYQGVERTIQTVRESWEKPGAAAQPNRPGWDALFDALLNDLRGYGTATDESDRLGALDHIYQISEALGSSVWQPAANLREEVREWLRPRVRLAWAARKLSETVQAMPATSDSRIAANRQRWVEFVRTDLGTALHDYDSAATVAKRQTALHRIHESLNTLSAGNQKQPWWPSYELEAAVNDLFNRPNLDIAADVNTVAPLFNANLVVTGPVQRKGYISQVTAGPKTGFGLMSSDDGIAFYNKQQFTSVTPVWDFQNRIAADPQGQRAAKLYVFNATSYDWAELTITTVLRSNGLQIAPSYNHSIDAAISSVPTEGHGLGRSIAALVGMDQNKINQKVYEGAIGDFRQQIPAEAQEEAQERIARETIQRNADLRAQGLDGSGTLAVRDFLIKHLSLRSRPQAVLVGGVFTLREAPEQLGADAPEPAKLMTLEPGIRANVHVGSLLGGLVAGMYEREMVRSVENVMIVIKEMPPGTPPKDGVQITKNVDFATYAKTLAEARKAKPGSPKTTVLRIMRPHDPPEFSTDARGFLVALVHDLQIDVPAPENQEKGGFVGAPAKIYRIKVPLAEVALSYKVDSQKPNALRVHAKVEDFNPGTDSQVLAIADDEAKGIPLSKFSTAFVLGAVGGQLRLQAIDAPIDQSQLEERGFAIRSISSLDPSGWVSVSLDRDPNKPLSPVEPIKEDVKPPQAHGPERTASTPSTVTGSAAIGQR